MFIFVTWLSDNIEVIRAVWGRAHPAEAGLSHLLSLTLACTLEHFFWCVCAPWHLALKNLCSTFCAAFFGHSLKTAMLTPYGLTFMQLLFGPLTPPSTCLDSVVHIRLHSLTNTHKHWLQRHLSCHPLNWSCNHWHIHHNTHSHTEAVPSGAIQGSVSWPRTLRHVGVGGRIAKSSIRGWYRCTSWAS